jgi:hypothetical protein
MSPHDAPNRPDGAWPSWSDARTVDERDTLPDTHEHVWRIGWIRMYTQWRPVFIIGRRRTTDGDWAVHAAWGMGETEYGWIRWSDRTVRLAEPPE